MELPHGLAQVVDALSGKARVATVAEVSADMAGLALPRPGNRFGMRRDIGRRPGLPEIGSRLLLEV